MDEGPSDIITQFFQWYCIITGIVILLLVTALRDITARMMWYYHYHRDIAMAGACYCRAVL